MTGLGLVLGVLLVASAAAGGVRRRRRGGIYYVVCRDEWGRGPYTRARAGELAEQWDGDPSNGVTCAPHRVVRVGWWRRRRACWRFRRRARARAVELYFGELAGAGPGPGRRALRRRTVRRLLYRLGAWWSPGPLRPQGNPLQRWARLRCLGQRRQARAATGRGERW